AQAIEQQNAQASEYAAQTGSQPMLAQAPQVPPMPPGPFEPRIPVDYEPMPAKVRHRQLARQMAASKFQTFAPEWQQTLLAEYAEMKNAAGIMTVPEQQQIQQQQQQAQAQAAQAGAQAEQEQAMATEQAEAQKVAADREAQASVVPPAPPVVNVYVPDTNTAKRIVHERNERGEVIGSQVVPIQ
ncbi:MAG TPA: hypothetical protein VNM48_23630, partial [Chloroflexota bacterium]|nr:hypothetical protein [Chloroflexota bacterium]